MDTAVSNLPGKAEVLAFITAHTGRAPPVWERADLFATLDLDGARAEAFMTAFARHFAVDLGGYEARFHHRGVGRAARFGWPLPVSHRFGLRMPIPLSTLVLAAQSGGWPLHYPQLVPVQSRDWVNWPLILLGLPTGVALLFWLLRGTF